MSSINFSQPGKFQMFNSQQPKNGTYNNLANNNNFYNQMNMSQNSRQQNYLSQTYKQNNQMNNNINNRNYYNNNNNNNNFSDNNNNNNQINPTENNNIPNENNNQVTNPNPEFPEVVPERTLINFFNDEFLSDSSLQYNEIEKNFHRIILSSSSEYIYNYFKNNPCTNAKAIIKMPELINTEFAKNENFKENVEIVFKYCYSNQNFKEINDLVNDKNIFDILSIAYSLQIKSLIRHLEIKLIKDIVKVENSPKLMKESLLFELPDLKGKCIDNLLGSFNNIQKDQSGNNNKQTILDFNYDLFKEIISSDSINVDNEKDICELIVEYIKQRRELQPVEPIAEDNINENNNNEANPEEVKKEEELPPNENENNPPPQNEENKEEENKNEENKEEEKKDEENKEEEKKDEENKEEENKNEENKEEEKKDEEPKQENAENPENAEVPENANPPPNEDDNDQDKNNGENEEQLLNSWKQHIDNIQKDLGKVPLTKEQERNLILCIRFSFLNHNELMNYTNHEIIGEHKDLILQALSVRLNSYEGVESNGEMLINLTPRKNYQSANANPNLSNNNNEVNNNNNNQMNDINNNRYEQNLAKTLPSNNNNGNFYSNNNKNMFNKNFNTQSQFDPNQMQYFRGNTKTDTDNNSSHYNYELNNRNMNQYLNKSGPMIYPPQDPKISKDFYKNMSLINKPRPIFKYEYDFDENGVLYYLGTMGKTSPYKNPHEIGQVKAFGSSLGKGQFSDFVGRNLVNLRTLNEEASFFGVDLGEERYLIPSSYSIRNRNSSSHVMLCWNLEGSNDKINFEVLDTRIFNGSNNNRNNSNLEKEKNMLKSPGCTSTWGVSRKIRENFPQGFRYFIIKQIDKNSSGGYNLAISGFEMYGEGVGRNWNFC